jgi:hypothetical protein
MALSMAPALASRHGLPKAVNEELDEISAW